MYNVDYGNIMKSYYVNLIEGYTGIYNDELVSLSLKSLRLLCRFLEMSCKY